MKKLFKIFLIVGACLLFIGGGIFVVAFAKADFNIRELSPTKTREDCYEETSTVTALSIDYNVADITIVATDSEKLSVTYTCPYNRRGDLNEITITEENGTLSMVERTKQHISLSFFNFYDHRVRVNVPKDRVLNIQIQTDTGDINLGDGTFGKIDLDTDTGDITLGTITATEMNLSLDTGDVEFNGAITTSTLTMETDTGDVDFNSAITTDTLAIKTNTGDIDGGGVITAQSVEIETSTGDIDLTLSGAQTDYTIVAETNTGDQNIHSGGNGERKLSITCSTGDIEIDFR